MLEIFYNTVIQGMFMVTMLTPSVPYPVEYTATSRIIEGKLGYHPQKGWINYGDCNQECKIPANTRKFIFANEWSVNTLGDLQLIIHMDGRKQWSFQKFFGETYGVWDETR